MSEWCPGPESNRYAPFGARDFKSRASASFATRARMFSNLAYHLRAHGIQRPYGHRESLWACSPKKDLSDKPQRLNRRCDKFSFCILSLFLATATILAAEDLKTATVAGVKAHEQGRISYWEGRVPIYDHYPFFDI